MNILPPCSVGTALSSWLNSCVSWQDLVIFGKILCRPDFFIILAFLDFDNCRAERVSLFFWTFLVFQVHVNPGSLSLLAENFSQTYYQKRVRISGYGRLSWSINRHAASKWDRVGNGVNLRIIKTTNFEKFISARFQKSERGRVEILTSSFNSVNHKFECKQDSNGLNNKRDLTGFLRVQCIIPIALHSQKMAADLPKLEVVV